MLLKKLLPVRVQGGSGRGGAEVEGQKSLPPLLTSVIGGGLRVWRRGVSRERHILVMGWA